MASGVTEEQLRDYTDSFKAFDKDNSGCLDHQELKTVLRALDLNLPVVEEGQPDPEFEAILQQIDPNADSTVSLDEFIRFMIHRETVNIETAKEVSTAFRAAAGEKAFITQAELKKTLTAEQAVSESCFNLFHFFVCLMWSL